MIVPSHVTRHHALSPRGTNDNGTANSNLSNGAIIVIVLVAAGFLVLIGFSVTRFFFDKDDEMERHTYRDEQMQHMHSLRRRNFEDLKHSIGVYVSPQQHYHPGDLRSSGVSMDQSSHASRAFSP
jgi:hypothetical protein